MGVIILAIVAAIRPEIRIVWPPKGYLVKTPSVELHLMIAGNVDDGNLIKLSGEKLNGVLQVNVNDAVIGDIEPGTYWTKAQIVNEKQEPISSLTVLHFERVLTIEEAQLQRKQVRERRFPIALPHVHAKRPKYRKICIVPSNWEIDGQKRIWLRLIESLKQHPSTTYDFQIFHLDTPKSTINPFAKLDVNITIAPITVSQDTAMKYKVEPNTTMKLLADYAVENIQNAPGYLITLWERYIDTFSSCRGAILLYANARDHGDRVLSSVAQHIGAAGILMELSSVFPVPHEVDAIVSPSHYAQHHESVVTAMKTQSSYVISPGVDTELFIPSTITGDQQKDCLIVGFHGRIAPDKSLGLFAQAMILLKNITTICLEFRWVGDGPDKEFYKEYPVKMMGSIYNESLLVKELQTWDLYVSAALRETFCIANIEAMAVGLPLVTFGVAGITEYAYHGINAWVVHDITPEALSLGIKHLAENTKLRQVLGQNARATIVKSFQWSDTVAKYDEADYNEITCVIKSNIGTIASSSAIQFISPSKGGLETSSDVVVKYTVQERFDNDYIRLSGNKIGGVLEAKNDTIIMQGTSI
ncbi:hypothetical protein THRCLA_11586, partial [Thraustotheca clavata]